MTNSVDPRIPFLMGSKDGKLWHDEDSYQREKGKHPIVINCKFCNTSMTMNGTTCIPVHPRPSTHVFRCTECGAKFSYMTRENTPEDDNYIISDEQWSEPSEAGKFNFGGLFM